MGAMPDLSTGREDDGDSARVDSLPFLVVGDYARRLGSPRWQQPDRPRLRRFDQARLVQISNHFAEIGLILALGPCLQAGNSNRHSR